MCRYFPDRLFGETIVFVGLMVVEVVVLELEEVDVTVEV